jgi:hypothetical protein
MPYNSLAGAMYVLCVEVCLTGDDPIQKNELCRRDITQYDDAIGEELIHICGNSSLLNMFVCSISELELQLLNF